jgi:DNA-binding SARP family transcriptional activator/tetratricopeptide (TPR) repeat protein
MPRSTFPPSSVPRRVSVRLLGPVAVEVDGSPLAVDTRKAVALLAYLAVTGRPAARDTLAALLWPEADGPGALGALRRTLSVLRSGLGEGGLVVDRSTVALVPATFDVDQWAFEAALAVARGHDHGGAALCRSCRGALQAASALDRGEFMAGFTLRDSEPFEEWQLAEAASYRRELAAVLERLAVGEAAARAWEPAASAIRRWLELDPLHEPAHRLLMEVLARSGEQAAALAQYRDCVRVLDRELGVAPLSETSDLAEAIRAGRLPAPDAVAPPTKAGRAASGRRRPAGGAKRPGNGAGLVGTPLVGRGPELEALLDGYGVVGPSGRLLVIDGEPGIGKTRLARAVADAVRARGGAVLEARVYRHETGIAFAPVVELVRAGLGRPGAVERLRTVDPELLVEATRLLALPGIQVTAPVPAILDPFGQARLFEALSEILVALAAGPAPGLLWLDDISWADASTIDLVRYLSRRLWERPIAVLVTARSEELAAADRERTLAGDPGDGLVVRVELGRLDRAAVATLASASQGGAVDPARIDDLFERSEGLPLYVVEALAAPTGDWDRIPGSVAALLRARLESAGEVAAQVVSAAAVIGRSFDLGTVRAASGRSDEETVDGLDEALRRGLVREIAPEDGGDVRYDFTHGRLRDVAYERMSLARRRLLHGRVAEVLAAGAGPGVPASGIDPWSLVAHHEMEAGRTARAAEAHRRAGDHARSVYANAEAREHLEAALALGSPATVELHAGLGEVLMLQGDYDAALGHLEAADALAGPADGAAIQHRIGLVLARRGDWARAEGHLLAALDLIGVDGAPGIRSRILVDRSAIAQRAGDPDGAEQLAEAALALAEAAGDPVAVALAEDLLGIVARNRGDLGAARSHLERALALVDPARAVVAPGSRRQGSIDESVPPAAGALMDAGVRIAALNTLALVCADAGERDQAVELTREALVLCERQGDRHRQAALENNLADLLQALGRHDEAMDHLKRAVVLFAEIGGRPGELEPEIWKLVEW